MRNCNGGEKTIVFDLSDPANPTNKTTINVNLVKLYRKGSTIKNCLAAYNAKHGHQEQYSDRLIAVANEQEFAMVKKMAESNDHPAFVSWAMTKTDQNIPLRWGYEPGKISISD